MMQKCGFQSLKVIQNVGVSTNEASAKKMVSIILVMSQAIPTQLSWLWTTLTQMTTFLMWEVKDIVKVEDQAPFLQT